MGGRDAVIAVTDGGVGEELISKKKKATVAEAHVWL